MYLARYAGLRIHECFRIDTATAERALRENAITIKGKGGKVRTVPINEQIAIAMRKQLERTPRGHKLLVPDDMPTDRAINHLQFFIMRHRDEVRDVDSDRPMTSTDFAIPTRQRSTRSWSTTARALWTLILKSPVC